MTAAAFERGLVDAVAGFRDPLTLSTRMSGGSERRGSKVVRRCTRRRFLHMNFERRSWRSSLRVVGAHAMSFSRRSKQKSWLEGRNLCLCGSTSSSASLIWPAVYLARSVVRAILSPAMTGASINFCDALATAEPGASSCQSEIR